MYVIIVPKTYYLPYIHIMVARIKFFNSSPVLWVLGSTPKALPPFVLGGGSSGHARDGHRSPSSNYIIVLLRSLL